MECRHQNLYREYGAIQFGRPIEVNQGLPGGRKIRGNKLTSPYASAYNDEQAIKK
jgi:hypothetical protein